MKKLFKNIIVISIILQSVFGFVLPAQAQTTDLGAANSDNSEVASTATDSSVSTQAQDTAAATRAVQDYSLQEAAREANKNNPPGLCSWDWKTGFSLFDCIGNLLLIVGGAFVGISGTFLNYAIDITVLQMSKIVNDVGVISAGWKTFRDLANMFFIFILIYIAIATIIGATDGGTKKMLVQVIIVALLINFSMFFTKVVIDASNILAIQFYNSINTGGRSAENGLSWTFLSASKLTTIYKPNGEFESAGNVPFKGSNILLIGFFGLIFAVILSFCFLAIGILFVIRFVILLFLMMLSPIALLGTVVGRLGDLWHKWLNTLTREVIFAPTIMAMLWIIASIINNPAFINAVNIDSRTDGTFANVIVGTAKDSMYVAINFGILIAMLIAALVISRSFSGSAGGAVLGVAEKWSRRAAGGMTFGAAGLIARNTIGRGASKIASTDRMKDWAATSLVGRGILKGTRGIAGAGFDARGTGLFGENLGEAKGKGGYQSFFDKQLKDRVEFGKSLGKDKIYADKEIKEVVGKHKEEKERAQSQIDSLDEQIASKKKLGASSEEISSLEKQKFEAMKTRDAAATNIKEIDQNPMMAKSREERYAEDISTKAEFAGGKFGDIETIFTKIARKNKEAAKKIQKEYKEEREKKDREWKSKMEREENRDKREAADDEMDKLREKIRENEEKIKEAEKEMGKMIDEEKGNIRSNIDELKKQNRNYEDEIRRAKRNRDRADDYVRRSDSNTILNEIKNMSPGNSSSPTKPETKEDAH